MNPKKFKKKETESRVKKKKEQRIWKKDGDRTNTYCPKKFDKADSEAEFGGRGTKIKYGHQRGGGRKIRNISGIQRN